MLVVLNDLFCPDTQSVLSNSFFVVSEVIIELCFCYYSECGYVATPIAMVQAALTILNEPAALPKT